MVQIMHVMPTALHLKSKNNEIPLLRPASLRYKQDTCTLKSRLYYSHHTPLPPSVTAPVSPHLFPHTSVTAPVSLDGSPGPL